MLIVSIQYANNDPFDTKDGQRLPTAIYSLMISKSLKKLDLISTVDGSSYPHLIGGIDFYDECRKVRRHDDVLCFLRHRRS